MKIKIMTVAAVMATVVLSTMTSTAGEYTNKVAPAPTSENQDGFKFQLGLTYISGMNKLADQIQANNPNFQVDTVVPVGLSFATYYAFGNGLGLGLNVGPIVAAYGDASFYIVPVGADVRYAFLQDCFVSPYLRAGIQYPFAGGDFIKSSSPGFVGAAGLEFGHRKHWGVEAGYNSSEVEVLAGGGNPAVKVKPFEFSARVYYQF